jgi:hypothetical protein
MSYIEKATNKWRRTHAEYLANTVVFGNLIKEGYSVCKAWNTVKSLGYVETNNTVMQRIKAENIKGTSKDREEYIDKLWTIFNSDGDASLELVCEIRNACVDWSLNGREWSFKR